MLAALSHLTVNAHAQRRLVFIKSQIERNFRLTPEHVGYKFHSIHL